MIKDSLRKKIFLSFMFLVLILALICIQAVRSLAKLGAISEQFVIENYYSISASYSMLDSLENHKKAEYRLVSGLKAEADELFQSSKRKFNESIDLALKNANLPGEEELVKKTSLTYLSILENYRWLEANLDKKGTQTWTEHRVKLADNVDKARGYIREILKKNSDNMKKLSRESRQLSDNFIRSMIFFSLIALIVGVSTSYWLTHIIVEPVESLTKTVMKIRRGNLDVKVDTDQADEIGILSTELEKMAKRLKDYQKLNLEKLIEEKKRSEAILRSVGDGLIVIDPDYRIIMVNPTAERIFYLLPGVSHGRKLEEVIKSEDFKDIISSAIEEKKYLKNREYPTFEWEVDRVKKHYQVKVFPVELESGLKIAYVILLEDVTKLKQLDEMKTDFITIASHELRTPLTSIIMSLGLVCSETTGKLNKDQKELLQAADEDARRMRRMMNNLLDISRIETGRLEMDKKKIPPHIIIQKVRNSFKVQAQSQKINFDTRLDRDLPDVLVDENRILQVFNNLMSNALRYTPEDGSIIIRVNKRNDKVQFSVSDTGPGISKEYQNKIFKKFVQVENDPKRGGAGLGLALSYEIIKAHGGSIWVESQPKKGSKFYFTLPSATGALNSEPEGISKSK